MRKTISAVPRTALTALGTAPRTTMATALLGLVLTVSPVAGISVAAAEPARENVGARDHVISDFCRAYPGASSCSDWQDNHGNWNNAHYEGFYRQHRYEYVMNTAEAAAAFGVTATTMSPSQKVQGLGVVSNHIYDCRAAFGSYDTQTDSYVAYDGTRQKCKL